MLALAALVLVGCHPDFVLTTRASPEALEPALPPRRAASVPTDAPEQLADRMIARLELLEAQGALRPIWGDRCPRRARRAAAGCAALRSELDMLLAAYQRLERADDPSHQRRVIAWVQARLPPPPDCTPTVEEREIAAAILHHSIFTLRPPVVGGHRCLVVPTTAGWVDRDGPSYGVQSYVAYRDEEDGGRRVMAMGNYRGCGQLEWVVEVREVRGVYRVVGEGTGR